MKKLFIGITMLAFLSACTNSGTSKTAFTPPTIKPSADLTKEIIIQGGSLTGHKFYQLLSVPMDTWTYVAESEMEFVSDKLVSVQLTFLATRDSLITIENPDPILVGKKVLRPYTYNDRTFSLQFPTYPDANTILLAGERGTLTTSTGTIFFPSSVVGQLKQDVLKVRLKMAAPMLPDRIFNELVYLVQGPRDEQGHIIGKPAKNVTTSPKVKVMDLHREDDK